jgi:hypothetical protein
VAKVHLSPPLSKDEKLSHDGHRNERPIFLPTMRLGSMRTFSCRRTRTFWRELVSDYGFTTSSGSVITLLAGFEVFTFAFPLFAAIPDDVPHQVLGDTLAPHLASLADGAEYPSNT